MKRPLRDDQTGLAEMANLISGRGLGGSCIYCINAIAAFHWQSKRGSAFQGFGVTRIQDNSPLKLTTNALS